MWRFSVVKCSKLIIQFYSTFPFYFIISSVHTTKLLFGSSKLRTDYIHYSVLSVKECFLNHLIHIY